MLALAGRIQNSTSPQGKPNPGTPTLLPGVLLAGASLCLEELRQTLLKQPKPWPWAKPDGSTSILLCTLHARGFVLSTENKLLPDSSWNPQPRKSVGTPNPIVNCFGAELCQHQLKILYQTRAFCAACAFHQTPAFGVQNSALCLLFREVKQSPAQPYRNAGERLGPALGVHTQELSGTLRVNESSGRIWSKN